MRYIVALYAALTLIGCGVVAEQRRAAMSDVELKEYVAAYDDKKICKLWKISRGSVNFIHDRTSAILEREVDRRSLGDCSDDHFTCVNRRGYSAGTANYDSCRQSIQTERDEDHDRLIKNLTAISAAAVVVSDYMKEQEKIRTENLRIANENSLQTLRDQELSRMRQDIDNIQRNGSYR